MRLQKRLLKIELANPLVLSAMSGIVDGEFAKKAAENGAALVILGGYSISKGLFKASLEISKRRREFAIPVQEIKERVSMEIEKVRQISDVKVGVNVRVNSVRDFGEFYEYAKKERIDLIEIDCHCRQLEIMKEGGGVELMKKPELVKEMLNLKTKIPVSLKVRGESDYFLQFITELKDSIDVLHVDAMCPGKKTYDLTKITLSRKILPFSTIVGNNSVRTVKDVLKMVESGADYVSIARGAMENVKIFKDILRDYAFRGYSDKCTTINTA